MCSDLHSIELEHQGSVFATFNTEEQYQSYLRDLAVEYSDKDFDGKELFDFKAWYCVFKGGEIISIDEKSYIEKRR